MGRHEKALSLGTQAALQSSAQLRAEKAAVLQATQVHVHAATEPHRLLDPHQVAHLSAVSLRQPQTHSATWHCGGVAQRERATCLHLVAARKILKEERAHLR